MKISLLHPSRSRPQLALKCFNDWMLKAVNKDNVEYILSLSTNDPHYQEYQKVFSGLPIHFVTSETNGLVIQANAAANCSTGSLLIAISDDFSCPNGWDKLLTDALDDKRDYVVKTDDGIQPYIMTLPMMDRAFYERLGHIYHPDYNHMYGDEELAEIGKRTGRTITLPLKFPHNHYSTGKSQKDDVNRRNDSFMMVDGETFRKRKAQNFGL